MNPDKRIEILEAFASSKPTEFEGFKLQWLQDHPDPVKVVFVPAAAIIESEITESDANTQFLDRIPVQNVTPDMNVVEVKPGHFEAVEEKQVRKRKSKTEE